MHMEPSLLKVALKIMLMLMVLLLAEVRFCREGGGKLRPRMRSDLFKVMRGIPIAGLAPQGHLQKLLCVVFPLGVQFPKLCAEAPWGALGDSQELTGITARIFHHQGDCHNT